MSAGWERIADTSVRRNAAGQIVGIVSPAGSTGPRWLVLYAANGPGLDQVGAFGPTIPRQLLEQQVEDLLTIHATG